jgi:sialate O-acetylesterase
MIAPVVPYAIRGAIWYQGESNTGQPAQYRELFPAMIEDWRARWGQGDFPFYFVQLANFMQRDPQPVESNWAELREAQLMTLRLHNTGMAVTIDIGEANDIHPRNKREVGRRLALNALAKTYGAIISYSGPIYRSHSIENGRIRLRFDHAQGLQAKGGAPLQGFAIAGEDGKFVWANAQIERGSVSVRDLGSRFDHGDTVLVWSDEIENPTAVRYGWANNPTVNLINSTGLPASPFRTNRL